MKVLIATPLYPPDIGGPATYSSELEKAIPELGHQVNIVYPRFEKRLPSGLRHILYFCRLWSAFDHADCILALDTFSVGVPALFVARLKGVPFFIRTGGDFLWEMYVARTNERRPLSHFYSPIPSLTLKEKCIFWLTRYLLSHSTGIIFSTEWQRDIWINAYHVPKERISIIHNSFSRLKKSETISRDKRFLWAGRRIPIKNVPFLESVFEKVTQQIPEVSLDISPPLSHEALLERMRTAYAIVLPSLADISPNFILDGLALGKPFLVTTETGIREFADGCGLFLDPLDQQAWVSGVIQMADDEMYHHFLDRINNLPGDRTYAVIARELLELIETSSLPRNSTQ